jgi:hypothetical protein
MGDRPKERRMRITRSTTAPVTRLRIDRVGPLAWAAQTEGGVEVAFDGWMELIGAVAELLNTNGRNE